MLGMLGCVPARRDRSLRQETTVHWGYAEEFARVFQGFRCGPSASSSLPANASSSSAQVRQ
jgi:hypothetical protein